MGCCAIHFSVLTQPIWGSLGTEKGRGSSTSRRVPVISNTSGVWCVAFIRFYGACIVLRPAAASRNSTDIPFRPRGFAQHLGHRPAGSQPRGPVRYVWAQVHDQNGVHGCAADGALRGRVVSWRGARLMRSHGADHACANDPREEPDLS
jgi:hypothetical protein